MKTLLKSALSITLLTGFLQAECIGTYCTKVTVERLYVVANGDILIETSGNELNLNCTSGGNGYFTIPNEHTSKNIFYSMLLTAKTTKEKLFLAPIAASPICELSYMYTNG